MQAKRAVNGPIPFKKRPVVTYTIGPVSYTHLLLERNHNEQFQKYMDTFFPEWRVVKETLNQQMLDYMSE